jgi:hypothetical protein
MLTLKYIQQDGTETLSEFDSVISEFRDGNRVIYAHRNDGGENCVQYGPILCGSAEDVAVPTVYVMNRFGATVATYRL